MTEHNELKREMKRMTAELKEREQEIVALIYQRDDLIKWIRKTADRLKDSAPLRISDYALLRYAEHERGVPVEAIRKEMEEAIRRVRGAGTTRIKNWLIRDGVVVTYYPD